jgi:hypothetical protein
MKLASILHDGRATVGTIDPDRSVFWTLADIISGLPPRFATDMVRLPVSARSVMKFGAKRWSSREAHAMRQRRQAREHGR